MWNSLSMFQRSSLVGVSVFHHQHSRFFLSFGTTTSFDVLHALSLPRRNDRARGALASNNHKGNAMRRFLTAAALVAVSLPAFAQSQMNPPANPNANTPAVNSPNSPPNPGAPVAGANSFTEGQARSRIEAKGFKNISDLQKDDRGVWRGKASQDGKVMNVSVD